MRSNASAILVEYLTSYPIGEKRLSGHIKQLINYCNFQFPSGRTAALDTLLTVVGLLSDNSLSDFAQVIFLPMTLKLANDSESSCRSV